MAQMNCPIHGDQRSTLVCQHIVDTVNDGKPRGFHWRRDDAGEYEGVCNECKQIPEAQQKKKLAPLVRSVCLQCFAEAGRKNGIVWPNDNAARG